MMLRATAVFFVLTLGSTLVFAEPERKKLQVFEDIQQQVNRYYLFTIFDDINAPVREIKVNRDFWMFAHEIGDDRGQLRYPKTKRHRHMDVSAQLGGRLHYFLLSVIPVVE